MDKVTFKELPKNHPIFKSGWLISTVKNVIWLPLSRANGWTLGRDFFNAAYPSIFYWLCSLELSWWSCGWVTLYGLSSVWSWSTSPSDSCNLWPKEINLELFNYPFLKLIKYRSSWVVIRR